MTWRPLGRILADSYAAAPFAVPLGGRKARLYYSPRDGENRTSIAACTLDLDSGAVGDFATMLRPGPRGAFDESGCTMSCLVLHGDRQLLYYTGWMLGRTVPFYLAAGLAASDDGGRTFRRHSAAPLLDRSDADPLLTASPSVILDNGVWRMWYVSALEWAPEHRYLIKYAESDDGLRWRRDGRVAIPFADEREYAMGRPHVMRDGELYRMWFCVRGQTYRLAYAESRDGLAWERRAIEAPPASDWDAEMQAYPMVLRDGERDLMFYNGNGYGATGAGWAEEER